MGYNDLAKEMGLTTIEIAKGSVEFLRQGKTISQTYELLRSSLILSKLGNLESAQSTEYLTSIMNGFKLEIEDVASAVDKLIQLDNISASSSGEIATAMSYSAAVANQTGVSFDKLAAIITVASNTTRMAGEVIGQSLKTILTRLQGVAAGKAVDEFGEDLNQVEKVLRKVGIEIRDSATSFRPMGDVLDEVGEKWEQYDDTQRAQIATAIAGKIMPEHTVMCGLVN
jgi:TP901 family phage tail tape measure protein